MSTLATISSELAVLQAKFQSRGIPQPLGEVNWAYDAAGKHIEAAQYAGAAVVGFNAGAGGIGSEARWKSKCDKITRGIKGGYMLAELVLISSKTVKELQSNHSVDNLIFDCAPVNKAILAYHRPTVIFQTGFAHSDAVVKAYDLRLKNLHVPRPKQITNALLKHYVMNDTPWLMIRHPSSFGFSNKDIEAIQAYAEKECGITISN